CRLEIAFLADREDETERGGLVGRTAGDHLAAMGFDDAVGNVKTEPEPIRSRYSRLLRAEEARENARQLVGGEPFAKVCNRNCDAVDIIGDHDSDFLRRLAVFRRISDQVREHLLDPRWVELYDKRFAAHLDVAVVARERRSHALDDLSYERDHVHRFTLD